MATDQPSTCSVLLHVRRTTIEDAYIGVPVTWAVMHPTPTADGKHKVDTDKLWAEGIRLSEDPRVEWQVETVETQVHPIQQPKPEDRRTFDPFIDDRIQ